MEKNKVKNQLDDLVILHINDLHGQLSFYSDKNFILHGGISMTNDYIKKVRAKNKNTFLGICGDILQEDIWGSDYKGTNTVNIINHIKPDAISLGNHEFDYGLSHLLIFNTCINSPILCANIMVEDVNCNLFKSSIIKQCGSIRLLLIGVIPKSFFDKFSSDSFLNEKLKYKDTYDCIRDEIASYNKDDYDCIVLMSHYGIEGDRILAEKMPKDIHVDIILGGHTHIDMDDAEKINDILIAQSSYGTTHVGRFDLKIDKKEKRIVSYKWNRVEINSEICNFDKEIEDIADKVMFQRKKKQNAKVLCKMAYPYKHESRVNETELGDIISDAFLELYPSTDFIIVQSGSIRKECCDLDITLDELKNIYPFDDEFMRVELTGKQIRQMFEYLFSLKEDGSVMNGTFQYSKGFKLTVDADDCWNKGCKILEMKLNDKSLDDDKVYNVGMTKNCLSNIYRYFNVQPTECKSKLLSYSTFNDLVHWCLKQEEDVQIKETGRFKMINFLG